MGSCCTVNRNPICSIIEVTNKNTNVLFTPIDDIREKKTSVCLGILFNI